jgi:uncharacterized protein YneF (UPF0154 family)
MTSYLVVCGLLGIFIGYFLGLHSKRVFKESIEVYIDSQMKALYSNMSHHIDETQKKCNTILEQAQKETINIYRKALIETEHILVKSEDDTGLN